MLGEGLKKEKSENAENFDGESMFEEQSEIVGDDENQEVPEKVLVKIDKLQEDQVRLNLEVREKNEKIIELLSELEEIKI